MSLLLRNLGLLEADSPLGLEWEALVRKSPSCFMQSLHWAKFKRRMDVQTFHLGLFDDHDLIGGALFYTSKNNKGNGFLVAPDGPILPWSDERLSEQAMQLIVAEAKQQSANLGTMALRIAPRLTEIPTALAGFSRAPLDVNEDKTMLLHLGITTDELLQSMKPKARYNIGLAQRRGVKIYEESSVSAVLKFCRVMEQVAARNEYFVEPLAYFIDLLETLCETGMVRLFFAEHEGDVLGAILLVVFGDRAVYLAGGTTDLKRNLMGGYALQWAAIQAAKEAGCEVYDFWGFDPAESPDNDYAGFSRFKSQFAGEAVQFIGTYDFYFVEHLADAVIRAFKEIPT